MSINIKEKTAPEVMDLLDVATDALEHLASEGSQVAENALMEIAETSQAQDEAKQE